MSISNSAPSQLGAIKDNFVRQMPVKQTAARPVLYKEFVKNYWKIEPLAFLVVVIAITLALYCVFYRYENNNTSTIKKLSLYLIPISLLSYHIIASKILGFGLKKKLSASGYNVSTISEDQLFQLSMLVPSTKTMYAVRIFSILLFISTIYLYFEKLKQNSLKYKILIVLSIIVLIFAFFALFMLPYAIGYIISFMFYFLSVLLAIPSFDSVL